MLHRASKKTLQNQKCIFWRYFNLSQLTDAKASLRLKKVKISSKIYHFIEFDSFHADTTSDTITLNAAYNFVAGVNYNIEIWCSAPNNGIDGNTANDTISMLLTALNVHNTNIGSDTNICSNKSILLDAGTAAGYTYLWSDNSTTQTITVDSSGYGVGTHTIWVIVTNSFGCHSTDSIELTFDSSIVVNLGADANICGSDSLLLDAGIIGFTYLWSDNSTSQTILVNLGGYGLGTHTTWVKVTNGLGCYSTDTINLTFVPEAVVNLGADDSIKLTTDTITLDASAGFVSYLWDDNSTYQTRQIIGSVIGIGSHTYYVDVVNYNGCVASDTMVITAIDDTGISDTENNSFVSIFPNPTKGKFQIDISGINSCTLDLCVLNMVGQIMYCKKLNIVNSEKFIKRLDLSNYPKGVYFIRLTTSEKILVEKIIIK